MTTFTTETRDRELAAYLDEVAGRLAGLPEAERAEIMEDLAQHLAEVMAEPGPPLGDRLGSPADYAAELLASAGVVTDDRRPGRRARLAALARRSGVPALASALGSTAVGRELSSLRPALVPAWQVARAYLAVSLLAAFSLGGNFPGFPVPRPLGSSVVGLVLVIFAVALSVRLGRAELGSGGRWLVTAANVLVVVYALVLVANIGRTRVSYVQAGSPQAQPSGCLADNAGRSITNLYAYDSEGKLIDTVLLYDQAGRPIDNLCPQFDSRGRRLRTEYRRDVNGAPVINAFPRAQSVETDSDPFEPAQPMAPGQSTPPGLDGPATVTVPPPAIVVPRLPTTATTVVEPTTTTTPAPPP